MIVHLSDDTVIELPVHERAEHHVWAAPVPTGLDVTSIDFVDHAGSTFHRLDVPAVPDPVLGGWLSFDYAYDQPDGDEYLLAIDG